MPTDLHKDKEIMARLEELKRRKRSSQSKEEPEDGGGANSGVNQIF